MWHRRFARQNSGHTAFSAKRTILFYRLCAMQYSDVAMRRFRVRPIGLGNIDFAQSILESTSIVSLAFQQPSGRPRGATFLSAFLSSLEEGISKARQYQRLARKSDAQLAELGIRREDLPRIVMFGRSRSLLPRRG